MGSSIRWTTVLMVAHLAACISPTSPDAETSTADEAEVVASETHPCCEGPYTFTTGWCGGWPAGQECCTGRQCQPTCQDEGHEWNICPTTFNCDRHHDVGPGGCDDYWENELCHETCLMQCSEGGFCITDDWCLCEGPEGDPEWPPPI